MVLDIANTIRKTKKKQFLSKVHIGNFKEFLRTLSLRFSINILIMKIYRGLITLPYSLG